MTKKKSTSSEQERRTSAGALFAKSLTRRQRHELRKVARLPDARIDYSDAPEVHPNPGDIHVGRFTSATRNATLPTMKLHKD